MKILVSGGAGFIGSHLVDDLLSKGNDVMVVDALPAADADNLEAQMRNPHLRYVSHDISTTLPAAVKRFKPARLYNLACAADPAERRRDPVHATMTAVVGTRQLLEVAQECGARFVQGSTGGVYGEPAVHPQPETYLGNVNPNGPRASHDEAARCAESLCHAYGEQHGVDVRVARIFSTFGPRMSGTSGRAISNFVTQALRSDDLTICGDGTQTRSYCYVDDMVRGLECLMDAETGGLVNLGSAEEHNLLQLAERVLRLTGSQSRLRYVALRGDDAHRRRPDVSAAERLLGWRPRVPLQQGLQSTVEFFRRQAPTTV